MIKRSILALALASALALPLGSALAVSGAPVAENLELTTYRNVSVGGWLAAVDPEGDALTFEITTQPGKGTVELTEDGRFVYTPETNRKGRDYFGYRAVDETGARSQEATVIIKIEKQKTSTTYADLAGHPAGYAATALAENGIFTAESVAGVSVFSPGREVTRGEFLSMCMALSGGEMLSGVASTGFADDADIGDWLKPVVATALMDGVVSGYTVSGGVNAPYVWLKTPGNMSSWEFFDTLLSEAGVVGTPGSGFGACGEGYFRLSAFGSYENTIKAIERITKM